MPLVETVSTTTPEGWWRPSGPRSQTAAAGWPLAWVGAIRQSPGEKRPATAPAIALSPRNQVADGGSSRVASRRTSVARAAASEVSNAVM